MFNLNYVSLVFEPVQKNQKGVWAQACLDASPRPLFDFSAAKRTNTHQDEVIILALAKNHATQHIIAIPRVTKRKTDSGRISGYYTAILSGKEDRHLWSVSAAKQFVSSLHQRGLQVSLFASVSIRSC